MSPRGREPEAGLCLSLPPAQLAEVEGAGGQMAVLLWQGSTWGHLLAVTQAVGGLQPGHGPQQVPVYRHICIFINKAFCSYLLSCLALTLGSLAALWSPRTSSGVGVGRSREERSLNS